MTVRSPIDARATRRGGLSQPCPLSSGPRPHIVRDPSKLCVTHRARLLLVVKLGTTWLAVACSPASSVSPPAATDPPVATRAPVPTATIAVPTATVRATLVPTPEPTPAAREVFRTPTPNTGNVIVQAADQFFNPAVITVKVGTTVTWNDVQGSHDVVADDGSFTSPTLFEGGSYYSVFRSPGQYHYVCSFHAGNGMFGGVIAGP